MFYINQQDYPDIPYRTNLSVPDSRQATQGTVASSGCGLCCMMMAVERLTMQHLSLEEALRYVHELKADMKIGTNMKLFGQACAERFGLTMRMTDDLGEATECLRDGGCVIMNVGGDHDDHIGVFSDVGHYVLIISHAGDEYCVLDPAYRPNKYAIPGRKGKLREDGLFLYARAEVLLSDTQNRSPAFYLFGRASADITGEP